MMGARGVHPAVDEINQLAAKRLNGERQYEMALIATKRAIRITPHSRELWCNLGTYYFNLQNYAEAESSFLRSLAIDPNFYESHCHLGLVYAVTRHFDKAEESFATALRLAPDEMAIKWDRSLMRLRRGQYQEGFKEYEIRIPYRKNTAYPVFNFPYWDGNGSLKGKTVYVYGEQGIGDTIMFSRFLPWLYDQGCNKVYMHTTALVLSCLSQEAPNRSGLVLRGQAIRRWRVMQSAASHSR